ncbi:YsnF/AvaK domain-containing protein, partial [Pseudarthrobacter albicanus]|uniref:YsnF/AvaK domain-containing protein n=1 Tax=Pseudarthrobacter albicanus TaxID=2823873 RepID=UPI001BA915C6
DATAPTGQRDATAPTGQRDATAPTGQRDATAPTGQRDATGTDRNNAPDTTRTTGYDTTAPTGQRDDTAPTTDAMTRPQTPPDIAEQPAPGRARLRKYVTTENVTRTVPVQREEVRIEREPITEENRSEAMNGPDKDDEREVILHEERLIVTKETVPVERVRIGTETVSDEVTINEEVRKEHIDTEGPEES